MITSHGWSGRPAADGAKGLLDILDNMKIEETGTFWHGNYGEGVKPLQW
jgi:hypothetical protein